MTETPSEIPGRIMTAAFNVILEKAYEIQNIAQATCPIRTGNLCNSIQVVIVEDSEDVKAVSIVVGEPYGVFVEAKTPFLGPAVRAVKPTLETALKDLQETVIDNVK